MKKKIITIFNNNKNSYLKIESKSWIFQEIYKL